MKKHIYLFLIIFPSILYGQISVTSSNLPIVGDTVILAEDPSNYSPGSSGVNQNWDFSSATGMPEMLFGFIDPSTTPYQGLFPNSNICVELDSATYYYLNTSINGLASVGWIDSGIAYPYSQMLLITPLNYLDTIINNQVVYQWDTLLSPPVASILLGGPSGYMVDSIKSVYGNIDKYIVDGWGQLQLPNGSFDALRVFETKLDYQNTFLKLTDTLTGLSQWVDPNGASISWNESRYIWRTNDSLVNWSLAEMQTDSTGVPYAGLTYYLGNSVNSIIISPAIVDINKLIDVSCYGYSDGLIMLDIFGTASPFTFSWTGPNGFTSSQPNIFNLIAGAYTVTVTDSNGNSVVETYTVYEPPLLTGSIIQSGGDLIVNPNGGIPPYSYLWSTSFADTLPNITPLNNGLYSCEIYDKAGCFVNVTFNVTNIPTNTFEISNTKQLIKVVDLLGREIDPYENRIFFFIYDDGSVEKRYFTGF